MQKKLGPVTVNHYRFRGRDEVHYGFTYTKENFAPYHPHTTYDLSVSYGRGCAFVEWRRKNK